LSFLNFFSLFSWINIQPVIFQTTYPNIEVKNVEILETKNQYQGPNTIPEKRSKGLAGIKNKGRTI